MICQQNAKELAAKSHEARRRNKELREAEQNMPQPEQQIAEPELGPDVARVRERLDKLDELMSKAEDDRSWDTLSRAYERMFKVWMVLTKTPFSGSLKPSQPRQQQRSATVEPIGPAPQAVVVHPESPKP